MSDLTRSDGFAACCLVILAVFWPAGGASAQTPVEVGATYLEQEVERPPTLSNLDPVPEDLGRAGAELGLADNETTGRFLGQSYRLTSQVVPVDGDWVAAATAALAESKLLVVNAPAEALLALADLPEAADALIFNAGAPDRRLRDDACRSNLLHTLASRAMRADALAQFLGRKRWGRWALIAGPQPGDQAFAEALRASATKFNLEIVEEKTWVFNADIRRNAAQEMPLFTQELAEHDVLLVTDEPGDFGRYLAFNTWDPRPVAGSEGLVPVTWSGVVEQWGAAQLQNRFEKQAGRDMRSEDYAAWAAMRSIGEAVTRTGESDPAALRDYILSDAFELAGFKGQAMSYRTWNGQLRQPIPLVQPRALVALAPIEGYLHQHSELDTLGLDAPESACRAFQGG